MFDLDVNDNINLLNDFKEISDLYDRLDSEIGSLNYKDYLSILMDDKYDNYQINNNNLKYAKHFNGEYLRDCLFEESCISAKVTIDQDNSTMFKTETISTLQKNYSYDNIRTRNPLVVPELVKNSTEFQVLKPEKKINIVGLLLIPPRLSYSNFNMKLEIHYFH